MSLWLYVGPAVNPSWGLMLPEWARRAGRPAGKPQGSSRHPFPSTGFTAVHMAGFSHGRQGSNVLVKPALY